MNAFLFRAMLGVCLLVRLASAATDPQALYERLICVVPMIGSGTLDDPRRPLYAPATPDNPATETDGAAAKSKGFLNSAKIVSYHSVMSDDGQYAIVEFVARDHAAFQPILQQRARLRLALELQKLPIDDLLAQLRVFKKDFDFKMLRGGTL